MREKKILILGLITQATRVAIMPLVAKAKNKSDRRMEAMLRDPFLLGFSLLFIIESGSPEDRKSGRRAYDTLLSAHVFRTFRLSDFFA